LKLSLRKDDLVSTGLALSMLNIEVMMPKDGTVNKVTSNGRCTTTVKYLACFPLFISLPAFVEVEFYGEKK